jgi:hypothetical protein
MRKYLSVAVAVAAIALGTVIWAKSSGQVVTTDGIAQPRGGISPYEMMRNAKDLPAQQIDSYY